MSTGTEARTNLKGGTARENCPACGASAARDAANYCLICGKMLAEGYYPLDTIRSSHHLQGRSFLMENSETEEIRDLFEVNRNSASDMARACLVYSLVPYLGILFVPVTFVLGAVGVGVSFRFPRLGGTRRSLASIALSFVVLAVQIVLWWLLYKIPEWGMRI